MADERASKRTVGGRAMRVLAVLFIIAVLAITSLPFTGQNTTAFNTATPDLGQPDQFPTVPPQGTLVTAAYTHFHSTGLMSMPKLQAWDLPAQEGEETQIAPDGSGFGRTGLMFINSDAQSVVHGFVERDPQRTLTTIQDLDKTYDATYFNSAWGAYNGGWRETGRRFEGDSSVIDFELTLRQQAGSVENVLPFLGRQLVRLDQDWVIMLRLVAPNNNPRLLDQLQAAVWPNLRLWRNALNTPLTWGTITDYAAGYMLKYPQSWTLVEGSPGRPYVVTGVMPGGAVTLTSRALPGTAVRSDAQARAWIATNVPRAAINRVQPEIRATTNGFAVSYADPDPDGNQRSSAALLINGPNDTLYVVTMQYAARGLDLLDITNVAVPPDFARIRNSFFPLPTSELVATATPTSTLPPPPPPPTLAPTPG